MQPARAITPPTVCTTVEPAKSRKTVPPSLFTKPANQPMRVAEPTARTPDPVAEDRVDEAGHEDAVDDVALEARAADHRARGDRRCRVGERELEQEEREERNRRSTRTSAGVVCRKKNW